MLMKGQEGGTFEWIGDYGKLLFFGILMFIFLLILFISYINSHPELGITLPELFGGGA